MTASRPPQYSMASGEISPLLFSRPDYQRNQTGLRACNGFVPLRQGGVTRAPGTQFRGNTRNNAYARLINFQFSENDAVTLEFTDGFMRVWRYGTLIESGGVPYELATPYDADALDRLWWVQSADAIYIADGQQPIQRLTRQALDNWSIAPANFSAGPFKVQNLDEAKTIRASGSTGTITLNAVGDVFDASWVGTTVQLKPVDLNISLWTGNVDTSPGGFYRNGDNIYEHVSGGNLGVNAPIHEEGTRRTDAFHGTRFRFVSDTTGIVRITAVTDANTATAEVIKTVPKPIVDGPTYRWSQGAWSEQFGYPSALEIDDQSLFAAFTSSEPRGLWVSTLGDFLDFSPSAEADGSFAYTIAGSDNQNSGTFLRRGRRGMYIGALGEVLRGFSNAPGQRIGPTTFDTEVEATDGARPIRPISPYGYPILVTKDGQRLQELRYTFEEDGGKPLELSLPSQHLGAPGFKEIVWQSAPQRLAWIRRGSGDLVCMLYDPEEQVLGFARCSVANGFVESQSINASEDSATDTLTMVVRREIDGQTVRYVEEQAVTYGIVAGDQPISQANHFFAASVFTPVEPTDTFFVPHLVNETVFAWTDVGQYGPFVVPVTGEVTLPVQVTRATIGLFDETHFFETLDIPADARDGSSIGREKRLLQGSGIKLHKTAAGRVQCVERTFLEPEQVSDPEELIPVPVASDLSTAYSGTSKLETSSGYADEVSLRFTPVGGAPMTVLATVPNIDERGA